MLRNTELGKARAPQSWLEGVGHVMHLLPQLKMLSPPRGMICNRMGMMFLIGPSIPAEHRLGSLHPHSLLQTRDPAVLPLVSSGLGRTGEHLSGEHQGPHKPLHCIWWSKTSLPKNGSLHAPCVRWQKRGLCFSSFCIPDDPSLQHPISPSPPAKVKLHLREQGETRAGAGSGWN